MPGAIFISEDPIGLRGGINRYVYAGGNPLQYTDPFGRAMAIPGPGLGGGSLVDLCALNPLACAGVGLGGLGLLCATTDACQLPCLFPHHSEPSDPPAPPPPPPPPASAGPQTPDQEALGGIINDATNGGRKPLSNDDADTVLGWAGEVGVTGARDDRNTTHWVGGPHIHVPGCGIRHIPCQ